MTVYRTCSNCLSLRTSGPPAKLAVGREGKARRLSKSKDLSWICKQNQPTNAFFCQGKAQLDTPEGFCVLPSRIMGISMFLDPIMHDKICLGLGCTSNLKPQARELK